MAFEFDPERALWKPGRRSFLFMFGAALVAPSLVEVKPEVIVRHSNDYENTWTQIAGENLHSGDWVSIRCGLLYRANST